MGARHHRDLEAWQLAKEVRGHVIALTSKPAVRGDLEWCSQARRAAGSACRNIAEGFWRYHHREFANFVKIARGSLGELVDLLDEAHQCGYLTAAETRKLQEQLDRCLAATTALYRFLSTTTAPKPSPRNRSSSST